MDLYCIWVFNCVYIHSSVHTPLCVCIQYECVYVCVNMYYYIFYLFYYIYIDVCGDKQAAPRSIFTH